MKQLLKDGFEMVFWAAIIYIPTHALYKLVKGDIFVPAEVLGIMAFSLPVILIREWYRISSGKCPLGNTIKLFTTVIGVTIILLARVWMMLRQGL